jgi:hypothetical protein
MEVLMKRGLIGWIVFAALMIGAATVWGLAISAGVGGSLVKRAQLADGDFDHNVGTKTTVLDLKWGGGPGQVGQAYLGELKGPNSFGIDDRGRIYILDEVNKRVVRYDGGKAQATFALPDPYFDDMVVSRDRFAVLSRDENRRVLLFDADKGFVATFPVAPGVGGITRLMLDGPDVCVECSSEALFKVGDLRGAATPFETQVLPRPDMPTPAGTVIDAALLDRNDIKIDIRGRDGSVRSKLRVHSKRQIGAIRDIAADRQGNVLVVYGLNWEDPTDPDRGKAKLVMAKYSGDGTLLGRAEVVRSDMPEPFRLVTMSESGDVYQLSEDYKGSVTVNRWRLDLKDGGTR